MYKTYWGLQNSPFSPSEGIFRTSTIDEAIARLEFLVDNQQRLGLLLGQPGIGKSVLLSSFAQFQRTRGRQVLYIDVQGMGSQELVWRLSQDLGRVPEDETINLLWRNIYDRLTVNRYQQVSTLVLLDNVGETDRDALSVISRLVQWEPNAATRLTVILAAETENTERIGRRLLELCDLRIELGPWTSKETAEFLAESVIRAGCDKAIFDIMAAERIHQLSGGIPRRIRHLSELSLVAGAGHELPSIDVATVEAVDAELSVDASLSV